MWKEKVEGKRKGSWEERIRKNTSAKGLGSCDRVKRGVCAKKEKGVFIVKRRERRYRHL